MLLSCPSEQNARRRDMLFSLKNNSTQERADIWCHLRSNIRTVNNAMTNFLLTCAGIKDGNIGELVQLVELDVSLPLFTVMIYL